MNNFVTISSVYSIENYSKTMSQRNFNIHKRFVDIDGAIDVSVTIFMNEYRTTTKFDTTHTALYDNSLKNYYFNDNSIPTTHTHPPFIKTDPISKRLCSI
jgi:hypothetical protein